MTLVYVDNVHKAFGDLEVLKGINLSVAQGEVVAIIGRSGSGKSTLLRCLNQLEKHDSGEITIADKQLDAASMSPKELSENVGMVFQSFNLFPHKTVGENVCLAPIVVRGEGKAEVEEIARAVLEKVGLSDKYDAYPAQLSGGQQQRVAIARALAMRPKVMLCDEVTSALDPELVGEVLRVLEALAKEGMTLILVTHEMSFARDVADRVVFMHQGRIHEEGAPRELFSNPQTPELKQFISAVL